MVLGYFRRMQDEEIMVTKKGHFRNKYHRTMGS